MQNRYIIKFDRVGNVYDLVDTWDDGTVVYTTRREDLAGIEQAFRECEHLLKLRNAAKEQRKDRANKPDLSAFAEDSKVRSVFDEFYN
jgi:hypothetical protein